MAYDQTIYPADTYWVNFTEQTIKDGSKGPYIMVRFDVLSRVDPADPINSAIGMDDTGTGDVLFLHLSEDAAPWTIRKLKALGWTGTSLSDIMPGGSFSLVGLNAQLKTVPGRNSKGEPKNDFELADFGGGDKQPIDETKLKNHLDRLDTLFGAEIKGGTPAPAPAPPVQQQTQPTAQAAPQQAATIHGAPIGQAPPVGNTTGDTPF